MLGHFFKRPDDTPGKSKPGDDAAPTPIAESQHTSAAQLGAALLAAVKCETVSDREAKVILEELDAAAQTAAVAKVAVDMAAVQVLTSAGIGALVQLHKRLAQRGGAMALYHLNDDIAGVMKLTRMDRLFTLAATPEAALAALAQPS